MKSDNLFNQKNISKGGLIGAVTGAAASTQFHKENDNITRKAVKTGIFASLGYLLGSFVEKLMKKGN
jgi:gas vesicle protein